MLFRDKLIISVLLLAIVATIGMALKNIIFPFIAGLVIAYLLHPLTKKLVGKNLPNNLAALLTTLFFITILILLLAWLFPLFYEQINMIKQRAINYDASALPLAKNILIWITENMPHLREQAEANISNILSNLLNLTSLLISKLLSSGAFVINLLSLLLVTPFVTYHALKDWEKMVSNIYELVPAKYLADFNEITGNLNQTLSGFLRGQTYVSSILAAYYAIALSIIGLDSGIALGLLTGILTFIPYIGALIAFLLCLLNIIVLYGDVHHITYLLIVFGVGGIVEANILSPKLIGDNVGLHPVWIMFGLLACASVLNFLGILIAVPLTATLGVFIKFSLRKYKMKIALPE
jgi:predicted PurR-regulated permease PerM